MAQPGCDGAAIAVLGAGSWGTALAKLLAENGQHVTLWGRDEGMMEGVQKERCNNRYLPGIELPAALRVCSNLEQAVNGNAEVLICVPSHAFLSTLQRVLDLRPGLQRLAWATKGLEPQSGRFLDDVARSLLGASSQTAVLCGPSFAREVAQCLPTAVTLASVNREFAQTWARRFSCTHFRAYTNHDMVGVQVCGGVKNVLAIAAGIADGLGYGANARAALVTRGLAELTRLGIALGARAETFMGLAGMGDLLLTCTDDQSRNRRFGLALAAGSTADDAQRALDQVVEGRNNAREVMRLAQRQGIEMPICHQVVRVLFDAITPREAAQALMTRALRSELDSN